MRPRIRDHVPRGEPIRFAAHASGQRGDHDRTKPFNRPAGLLDADVLIGLALPTKAEIAKGSRRCSLVTHAIGGEVAVDCGGYIPHAAPVGPRVGGRGRCRGGCRGRCRGGCRGRCRGGCRGGGSTWAPGPAGPAQPRPCRRALALPFGLLSGASPPLAFGNVGPITVGQSSAHRRRPWSLRRGAATLPAPPHPRRWRRPGVLRGRGRRTGRRGPWSGCTWCGSAIRCARSISLRRMTCRSLTVRLLAVRSIPRLGDPGHRSGRGPCNRHEAVDRRRLGVR